MTDTIQDKPVRVPSRDRGVYELIAAIRREERERAAWIVQNCPWLAFDIRRFDLAALIREGAEETT